MFFVPSDLRVSDADRESAVDFLKHHYAAGRLSDRELSSRVDAAYRADYDSQLVRLTDDLPAAPAPQPRAERRNALGPAAAVAAVAVGGVAVLAMVPAEAWGPLLAMLLPLVVMVLFTVGPIALPVIGFLLLARALAGPRHPRRGELPRRRGMGGGIVVWDPFETRRRGGY